MAEESVRLLYLARHAEPQADGSGLTPLGVRQAELLGQSLKHLPLRRIIHGPLARATETARVVASQFETPLSLSEIDAAGDYVPYVPHRDEVPVAWAGTVLPVFANVSSEEALRGASLGARAIDLLTGPAVGGRERIDVVITHAFTIGWLVRHALDAPKWRWWPPIQCHTGVTVIRYGSTGPPTVMVHNDMAHLPPDLQWTGFPDDLRL